MGRGAARISHMDIKLLHISSAGRSGSTLLGMALDSRPGFFYGGEIHSLWNDDRDQALCSCGEALMDCPVWKVAVPAALRASGVRTADDMRAARDSSVQIAALAKRRFNPDLRRLASEYCRMAGGLYQSLAASTDARVIVDSSQHVAHSLLTAEIAGITPSIIHLVRDPRAVVYSWSRARQWPTRAGSVTLQKGYLAAMRRWVMQNLKLMICLRRSRIPRLLLRYEDFVDQPGETLDAIMRLVGETPTAVAGGGRAAISVADTHIIKANPLRFHHGDLSIRADEQWRDALPPRIEKMITVMTYPLMRHFGYAPAVRGGSAGHPRAPIAGG